jgi:hypothetical protein
MAAAGVNFYIGADGGGCLDLGPKTAIEYTLDPIGTRAKLAGVTRERLLAFRRWSREYGRCRAKTREGRRCRGYSRASGYLFDPAMYDPTSHDYCRLHQEHGASSQR